MKTLLVLSLLPLLVPTGVEGRVHGKVRFDGERPERKLLEVAPEKAKGCCPESEKVDAVDPSLLVAEDGGLANVVVVIDVPGAVLKVPEQPFTIDQKKCTFSPHIVVVPAGSKVVFSNSDTVMHNVHTYSQKNDSINSATAPGGKEELLLAKGDRIKVSCDYHPWMSCQIYVSDSPYYAVTKADGSFEIPGLAPGTYSASFWHERFGRVKQDVTIKPDGTSDAVDLKMAEKKKKIESKPDEKPKG